MRRESHCPYVLLPGDPARVLRAASILNNVVLYQADVKEGISDYVDEAAAVAEGERRQIFAALEVFNRLG